MGRPDAAAVQRPHRTMSHQWHNAVIYVAHSSETPVNEDWDAFLDAVATYERSNGRVRFLVNTEMAGPNAAQRRKLNDLMNRLGSKLRVAVLSESMVVRGIIQALSWMNVIEIRSFPPGAIAAALGYLEAEADALAVAKALKIFEQIEKDIR